MRLYLGLLLALWTVIETALPSYADTGSVRVVFGKAALVAGVGGGNGVLTFRGKRYPFEVSGLSWGATAGISINKLVGNVLHLSKPEDLAGVYAATGAGAAVAAGVSSVRLQNAKGVILILQGAKFGVELSASYANVKITMK
jgi:hypothetical protein